MKEIKLAFSFSYTKNYNARKRFFFGCYGGFQFEGDKLSKSNGIYQINHL